MLAGFGVQAQDFTWWNQVHNWDGFTPWNQYMTYSHAYFGPNALPIPSFENSDRNFIRMSTQNSLRTDDVFNTLHTDLLWRRGKTQFHVTFYALEHYSTTTEVRDLRAARVESGSGTEVGDVLLNVSTEVWRNDARAIHFTAHLKTAAGHLPGARFTDAPGYAFFFTGIQDWKNGNWSGYLQTDMGFQVYQTFWADYPQNDGFQGNFKAVAQHGAWELCGEFKSYTGYFRNGDWPRIGTVALGYSTQNQNYSLGLTHGFNDYPFTFATVGMRTFF